MPEQIIEDAPIGVLVVDAELKIRATNAIARSVFAVSPSSVLGRDLKNILHGRWQAEDVGRTIAAFERTLQTGEQHRSQALCWRPQTSEAPVYFDWQINRVGEGKGQALAVCYFQDVTEQVRSGQELAESHERRDRQRRLYEAILSNTPDFAYVFDLDHRFTYANEVLLRTWGKTWDEAIGKTCLELGYEPWHAEMHDREIEKVIVTKQPLKGEAPFEGTFGRRIYEYIFVPVLSDEGLVEAVAGTTRDVTERRRAEEAHQEQERRFRAFIEQVKDYAIFTTDIEGRPTSWNEGVLRVLGFEEEEFIGQEIVSTIFTPEDILAGIPDREMEEAARTGRASNDRWMRKKDGTRYFAFGSTTAQYDEQGNVSGYTKVTRDQTDRKLLEEELATTAQKLADLHERKDEFLAMLSHELRNPLAPIRSAAQMLRLTERGDEHPMHVEARQIIERQTESLTRLVSDLLEVSRVVAGQIRLSRQVVDANKILLNAIQTTKPYLERRKHELVLDLCPEPQWINVDTVRIEEVFVNLLDNAAKYTPEGGHIWVQCEQRDDLVFIHVRDDGVGIDPALCPKVFDLFTQANQTLDRSEGGLGIGLSLASRLVHLHGGLIEVESPPTGHTKGSRFTVRLPAADTTQHPEAEVFEERSTTSAHNSKVLLVDDNVDSTFLLAEILKVKGFTVRTAHTGIEGLNAAHEWKPDVLILDIGLPGMSGYEVARHLREQPGMESVRLIAVTGYGLPNDVVLSREAGFEAHLVKPVDAEYLERLIVDGG